MFSSLSHGGHFHSDAVAVARQSVCGALAAGVAGMPWDSTDVGCCDLHLGSSGYYCMNTMRQLKLRSHDRRGAVTLLLIVATASLWAACRDALSPAAFAGEYALVQSNDARLPIRTEVGGDTHYVWSGSLVIELNSTARIETSGETRRKNGSVQVYRYVADYTTRVEADHLVMTFVCPINALCTTIAPRFLYREPGGRVRIETIGVAGPSRYVRVSRH